MKKELPALSKFSEKGVYKPGFKGKNTPLGPKKPNRRQAKETKRKKQREKKMKKVAKILTGGKSISLKMKSN